ncbi:MAG: sigma-70 family RNA polymerase sigma factor [Gemmataceae bacterium]|nr:sigma-70 family RNA polymerase sigma factor [Gemmataceae bacterium]
MNSARRNLLFPFCRLQRPGVALSRPRFDAHLDRTWSLYRAKDPGANEDTYLDGLYALDWFVACACLDKDNGAWEALFASRTGRADCLLVDALRARAARLYPRDEERQEHAVAEFWGQLLVAEHGLATLARYDGQRPLVPWLIRVFQNAHVSRLRASSGIKSLPDDDVVLPLPEAEPSEARWHDEFVTAARDSLNDLSDADLLLLGLRLRYRLSQREAAQLLGVHEGTVSRQTDKLRDRTLESIRSRLADRGWTGDDLHGLVLKEMAGVLLDDPRLGADHLRALLAARGKALPSGE